MGDRKPVRCCHNEEPKGGSQEPGKQTAEAFVQQTEGAGQIVNIIEVLQESFQRLDYRTTVRRVAAGSGSVLRSSASSNASFVDSLACAIARWNNSQRCRADSFVSASTAESVVFCLFDILRKRGWLIVRGDYKSLDFRWP